MAIYQFSLKNKADLVLNRTAVIREFREITGYSLKAAVDVVHQLEQSDFVVVNFNLFYILPKHPSRAEFFDVIVETTSEESSEAEGKESTFTEGQILAAYKEFANDMTGAYSFVAFLKKHIDPEYQEYQRLKEKFGE